MECLIGGVPKWNHSQSAFLPCRDIFTFVLEKPSFNSIIYSVVFSCLNGTAEQDGVNIEANDVKNVDETDAAATTAVSDTTEESIPWTTKRGLKELNAALFTVTALTEIFVDVCRRVVDIELHRTFFVDMLSSRWLDPQKTRSRRFSGLLRELTINVIGILYNVVQVRRSI